MNDTVANTVRDMRNKRGWTQEALADACHVSRQTIIAVEHGNYTPSVALALRLAHALKCTVEKLFSLSHV